MSDLPAELPDWIAQHVKLYQDDPDAGHMWDSSPAGGPGLLPTLLLTTIGKKSGQARLLPLIYGEVDGSYAIIASKGGFPTHPAWYVNLAANPNVEVQVGHDKFSATARTAEGAERQAIWDQMAVVYPPYNDYQVSAGAREIPVVVLDRA